MPTTKLLRSVSLYASCAAHQQRGSHVQLLALVCSAALHVMLQCLCHCESRSQDDQLDITGCAMLMPCASHLVPVMLLFCYCEPSCSSSSSCRPRQQLLDPAVLTNSQVCRYVYTHTVCMHSKPNVCLRNANPPNHFHLQHLQHWHQLQPAHLHALQLHMVACLNPSHINMGFRQEKPALRNA